jgi:hypothetical protein
MFQFDKTEQNQEIKEVRSKVAYYPTPIKNNKKEKKKEEGRRMRKWENKEFKANSRPFTN